MKRRTVVTAMWSVTIGRYLVTLDCGHRTAVRSGKGGNVPKSVACSYCGEGR